MAIKKSLPFLPAVFRTDSNQKFLSATLDQLISEPNLTDINGYIGRKFAPTYRPGDSYIIEQDSERQNYQLEPAVVIKNERSEITFFASYIDVLNKIQHYGGLVNNHSRLFNNEYYSYDPAISLDTLINFTQYYWLPEGPDSVSVSANGVSLSENYVVTRDIATREYTFSSGTSAHNSVKLARGGVYTFTVNQPGTPFWIQAEPGRDGVMNATPSYSNRAVLGVENNGIDVGTITFNVPPLSAQDRYVLMQTMYNVDFAVSFAYSDIQNKTISQFVSLYPEYSGLSSQLNGKTIVFVDQYLLTNVGEEAWTDSVTSAVVPESVSSLQVGDSVEVKINNSPTVYYGAVAQSPTGLVYHVPSIPNSALYANGVSTAFTLSIKAIDVDNRQYTTLHNMVVNGEDFVSQDNVDNNTAGDIININPIPVITLAELSNSSTISGSIPATNPRLSVFQIQLTPLNSINPTIQLIPVQAVSNEQKVFIKQGLKYSSTEFYVDVDNLYHQQPLITCSLPTLFYQDGTESDMYGSFTITQTQGYQLDIVNDIIGKKTYTSPNGISFTNGLKVSFDESVLPASYQNNTFYVEGVGKAIKLINVLLFVTPELYNVENTINYPGEVFPDYITINRGSKDLNAWTRGNRWFHRDVILQSSIYNNSTPVFDQNQRAQRPIIQFNSDLQLFNYGRIGRKNINILDTTVTDAFNTLDGAVITSAFGIELVDGLRIILAADNDPAIRNRIYVISMVQYALDINSQPDGDVHVHISVADDGESIVGDTVVVSQGLHTGEQWWYNGDTWVPAQQKTSLQQDPLFDVYDSAGVSFSTYNASTFTGTKLIGYARGNGINDAVLGFPLSYRSMSTQGDIQYKNYLDTDTFTYKVNQDTQTLNISTGFVQTIIDNVVTTPRNNWATVVDQSVQYQLFDYIYDGFNNLFTIDVVPTSVTSIPAIKVFFNNRNLTSTEWGVVTQDNGNPAIVVTPELTLGDKIDILVLSDTVSELGQYEVPSNLDLNAQNTPVDLFTLGQMRNHLVKLSQNTTQLVGNVLSSNNLRDIEVTSQGGSILQHSAPVPYASLFLLDESANFVDAIRYSQKEYTRFKNKFFELSASLVGIDPTNPVESVDLILTNINAIKNQTFPFYYSDMVPYGYVVNIIEYTIFDPLVTSYEISNVFSDITLSNKAVLVYHNGIQLIKGKDYTFNTDRPAITFTSAFQLEVDDLIKVVEYSDTDKNYIPETPSKLGLFPKYIPEIFLDNTYRSPITVIRGHDGSITPAFGDYRDDFLLELEKRIYNNIKLSDTREYADIYAVMPGKFRKNDYTLDEANQLLSINFLNWLGNNKLDYTANDSFNSNDAFTWNYSGITDRLDGTLLQGSWRACYMYFYDTIRPNTAPWEMLGFTAMPTWWENYYGPGPYTGGNTLLWEDLEAGLIQEGDRAGTDPLFARPGLTSIIPVDASGFLLSPAVILADGFNSAKAAIPWTVGQIGPAEYAWRTSSEFPFAVQMALALAKPAKYFSLFADTYRINKNQTVNQWLTTTNSHITQASLVINGTSSASGILRSSGYLNWIASYLTNIGIDPLVKIKSLITEYKVQLAYKLAGFSDQRYMQVLAEQSSPGSSNANVFIPAENYEFHLYKSAPVDKLVYSSVIVEKTTSGYSVRGYDLSNPFFTIIPSIVNNNGYKISVLDSYATIFNNYQAVKLIVPYGYEFTSQQQLVDFLVSYQRYLVAQGFTFTDVDPDLYQPRDWVLSAKEFLYWTQQGWGVGSILVLSPVANVINLVSVGSITDEVTDSQYGTKVMDQNYNIIKKTNYTVMRSPTNFKLTLLNDAVIGLIELNLVQYEHVIVFDNKTVFNDIIYEPELGNRQYRLKLVGQKTAGWDGSLNAPGFIYNSSKVDLWAQGTDYLKGDLVEYKTRYYVALSDVIASSEFGFDSWQPITSSQIKVGLLPNLQTLAFKPEEYYNPYSSFDDINAMEYSHGLIGFRNRRYLSDLGLSTPTQIEFYKGFIKQKGTYNAVSQLSNAQFNNLNSAITMYEEWAVRVGEYGALANNPYVEISLDEQTFSVNPAQASFVGEAQSTAQKNTADGVSVFNSTQLYKSEETFDGTIALNRDTYSDYENDVPTAGYVNINDVDVTIFDLSDISSLNTELSNIGSGYTIWTTKDFTKNWNVFRVTETDVTISQLANSLDNLITVTTKTHHNLEADDAVLIRNFNTTYDGFYKVQKVLNYYDFVIEVVNNNVSFTTIEGDGILYKLDSVRFKYMADAAQFTPPHGWKAGDRLWVDAGGPEIVDDIEQWNVYEKTEGWQSGNNLSLKLSADEYEENSNYGSSVKLAHAGSLAIVGLSNATAYKNNSILGTYIIPLGIYAWGENANGQLGLADVVTRSSPVQVGTLTNWAQLTTANNFTIGITTDFRLWSWGNNTFGQLGNSTSISLDVPAEVGMLTDWLYVSAAQSHVAAIKTDGTLWAWGLNDYGQLGIGASATSISSPVQVGSLTDWMQVSCGDGISAAVKQDGTLWAWGNNDYGQLGLGDVALRNSPVQIGTLTTWTYVSCGL